MQNRDISCAAATVLDVVCQHSMSTQLHDIYIYIYSNVQYICCISAAPAGIKCTHSELEYGGIKIACYLNSKLKSMT